MTAPVTTEALVESFRQHLAGSAVYRDGVPIHRLEQLADALIAGPLAPLLVALQQVTAERDEARAKLLEFGEMYDREDKRVAAEIATAAAELARLRAEGEAKDRALKAKAEEQVAYWRERQRAAKCLEDGVSEDGQTYTPIGDEAAWQGGYCNGRMSEADWWAKTFQYWPNEAARAATAREE